MKKIFKPANDYSFTSKFLILAYHHILIIYTRGKILQLLIFWKSQKIMFLHIVLLV